MGPRAGKSYPLPVSKDKKKTQQINWSKAGSKQRQRYEKNPRES